jgi:hypothetical protein
LEVEVRGTGSCREEAAGAEGKGIRGGGQEGQQGEWFFSLSFSRSLIFFRETKKRAAEEDDEEGPPEKRTRVPADKEKLWHT